MQELHAVAVTDSMLGGLFGVLHAVCKGHT